MNLEDKSFLAKFGVDATIVLAAATGLLYFFGTQYRNGYLSRWGIESSLFENDIYENLIAGFVVIHIIFLFVFAMLIVAIVSLIGYNGIAIELSKNKKFQEGMTWLGSKCSNKRETDADTTPPKLLTDFEKMIFKLLFMFSIIFMVLFIFYKAICCSSELGETYAVKEYEQYSKDNPRDTEKSLFNKLRTYCIDGVERKALLLATDRNNYALYLPKGKAQNESVEIISTSRINCIKAEKNITL